MAVIETSRTVSAMFPSKEHITLREAAVGVSYHGSVTSFRRTRVTSPDSIRYEYPDLTRDFETEQINHIPSVVPAALDVRLGLRPFPGIVKTRSDLLWTPRAESVLEPARLFIADDVVLSGASTAQLELAHDLASITQTGDEAAYVNWFTRVFEQLDQKIPQGAVVEAFVKSVALGGLGVTVKNRNKAPLIAAMQGLLGMTVGNTLGSVVSHRMASHGSVKFTPPTARALRLANALTSGSRPDTFAAMHKVHHAYADTPHDPHSPLYQGRWKIFFGIKGISQTFMADHPELLTEQQQHPNTRHLAFENPVTLALGIAGTHWLLGEMLKQPLRYRAYAAAIHAAGLYMIRGAFTGDSHPDGAPHDFPFSPLTSVVMGGETDHAQHHDRPYDPKHAAVDPGYALIWLLQRMGLADIPAKELLKNK